MISRETYKYYSAVETSGGIFSLGTNVFTDMISQTGIIDGVTTNLSDLDLEFVSTNAGKKKSRLNPDRALVRYQMLEVIMRMSKRKFFTCMILM